MAGHSTNRSKERSCPVAFRLSPEDRDLLKQRAQERGLSVQAYLEMVALGRPEAHDRRPGPNTGQMELDMAVAV